MIFWFEHKTLTYVQLKILETRNYVFLKEMLINETNFLQIRFQWLYPKDTQRTLDLFVQIFLTVTGRRLENTSILISLTNDKTHIYCRPIVITFHDVK